MAAGRESSAEGLVVLLLAERLAAGGGTQAGVASLARQFAVSLDAALKGAGQSADVIDGIFGT